MRYLMMVKSKEGLSTPPELFEAVGKLGEEMGRTGVLLDTMGLAPSRQGARIRLANRQLTVTDGPFTEAKEVVGGLAVLKAASRSEAIEHGRRFMQVHADILGPSHELELEIREVADAPEGAAGR